MINPLKDMVEKRKIGIHCGIPSYCSANKLVIEAALEQSKRLPGQSVLIEATSNQVNQDGGYTKMLPADFKEYVYKIAERIDFDKNLIVLGGDHLGPLPWCDKPAAEAMEQAKILVQLCVSSGYTKIHLDTSMKLGDDPAGALDPYVVAERGAFLYKAAEEAFAAYLKDHPDAVHPVYVIGSEVPIPGGDQEEGDHVEVTTPKDFENTLRAYKEKFHDLGLDNAWENIIAVVVQPGVEFGNADVHNYNRLDAADLCKTLKKYPDIVFEGHSTDYQTPQALNEMVQDGIAIIKVGPALTFAVREGLYALSMMEKELITDESKRANFIEILEQAMLANPKYWEKYYDGDAHKQALSRKYGFSDRSRYYMTVPEVDAAIDKLLKNIDDIGGIPLNMLRQYMPAQFKHIREGSLLNPTARDLVKDKVVEIIDDYNYAVIHSYMTANMF